MIIQVDIVVKIFVDVALLYFQLSKFALHRTLPVEGIVGCNLVNDVILNVENSKLYI